MQVITINSRYDAEHTLFDVDSFYNDQELCIRSGNKLYYVRPKYYTEVEFCNEEGKPLKRVPNYVKTCECSLKKYYSNVLTDEMKKRGFCCSNAEIWYINRKEVYSGTKNFYSLFIGYDYTMTRQSLKGYEVAWLEEIRKIFPSACNFHFEDKEVQAIHFTLPECE